ncbi:Thoeris anti-defense Tad2 family protein [Enterococcus sp. LJL90]
MGIKEAIEKAQNEQKAIRKKSWCQKGLAVIPTNSEALGMFLITENGKKGIRYWNPSADDLTSVDWELF